MQLQIGPNIDNTHVRLDFKRSLDSPNRTPSYEIKKSKAKEFVKKYNAQENRLQKTTIITSLGLAVLTLIASIKKHSIKFGIFAIPSAIITGLGISILLASHKKNNLMEEYNVKAIRKK